jgi:hypothetical protein
MEKNIYRLLLKYHKRGEMVYLSHLETVKAMERALRRADLPLAYSRGFSPHPRITSSPALPVGVGSEGEYLEVSLRERPELSGLAERINRGMPEGLRVIGMELLPPHFPKISRWIRYALYRVEVSGSPGKSCYLLLPLAPQRKEGEAGGIPRLRDALSKLCELEGWDEREISVVRQGLYASVDEVLDEVSGRVIMAVNRDVRLSEVSS